MLAEAITKATGQTEIMIRLQSRPFFATGRVLGAGGFRIFRYFV
jgi:hypothetical protein